ncbi:MAG: right-handed parallel beta-helix repeat-containing protein, partial [Bacteroidota bacterium]
IESLIAYQNGFKTEVKGKITGKIFMSTKNTSQALQAALDRIQGQKGGKLEIESGDYQLDFPLTIYSNTTIQGNGKSTTLHLSLKNANNRGVLLKATDQDQITISDLKLKGAPSHDKSSGIVFEGVGLSVINSVQSIDFSGYGFWIRENSFACKLENNYTSGNDMAGTYIDRTTKGRGGHFVPNKIMGCYSYAEDGNGFEFFRAICQNFVGNVVHLAKGNGIYMKKSTSNLITGNRVFMGQSNGIVIEDTFEMNISGNICGWNWGDNLVLDHCVWGTVTANEFIDAGGREREGYGIYMKRGTKSVQVTGNAIFNWWDNKAMTGGVYEAPDCLENQITDNIINYYKDFDVRSLGKNSITGYNLGLPHPYGPPAKGPNVPNVKPEDIKLNMHIRDSRKLAEEYLIGLEKNNSQEKSP